MTNIAHASEELPIGSFVGSRYEVVRILGRGGMGAVYEVKSTATGGRFALKLLHAHIGEDPENVERFAREARAAGGLRSAHTARVFDADQTAEGDRFIVMELLEGHDVATELRLQGRLPVVVVVGILLEVCVALAEAHARGIVHRDLKPANLFLARRGRGTTVKVLDFGIAKEVDADNPLTLTAASIGTPSYMSPEQVIDARHVDGRADIWALGVIGYQLLTGALPFRGSATAAAVSIVNDVPPALVTLAPEVPFELEAVLLRALSKAPGDRPGSVEAFARLLLPFADERTQSMIAEELGPSPGASVDPTTTSLSGVFSSTPPPMGRRRWAVPVGALAAVILAVLAAGLWARGRHAAIVAAPPPVVDEPAKIEAPPPATASVPVLAIAPSGRPTARPDKPPPPSRTPKPRRPNGELPEHL